jgi:hypothetical protein
MSEIKLDIPDILVVIDKGDQYNVTLTNTSANVVETTNTFFTVADFATLASSSITSLTASYALTNAGTVINAVNAISASFAATASSINFIPTTSSFAITASAAASITFTPTTASFSTTSSFATTSSYALNAGSGIGFPFSGSAIITGSLLVSGGNIIGTSSLAQAVIGGKSRYVPLWTGSSGNELTSSIIYQTDKGIFIGYDTTPHVHSAEGETLAVHSGETGVKNVIYAHGTFNDDYRVNIRNISSGVSASTNFKATSDVGNDFGGYVQMGINSSTYTRTDQIGGPLDAYVYTTGSDLLLGTLSPDKRIVLFTGPGDADNNARVFIDSSGSVAII